MGRWSCEVGNFFEYVLNVGLFRLIFHLVQRSVVRRLYGCEMRQLNDWTTLTMNYETRITIERKEAYIVINGKLLFNRLSKRHALAAAPTKIK